MKRSLLSLLLLFFLTCLPALAQEIEDPGPYPVGWRDVTFVDEIFGQGTITGRMYYPALSAGHMADPDPSSGPYPLVGFQHGWLSSPDMYDNLCTHIASWGFVIASTGTETGFYMDMEQFARDTRSFLHWVDSESNEPGSWLFEMAWDGDWAASGHSMGGGTLSFLIGIEPRVRTIVGLQALFVTKGIGNMQAFTGNPYQIAGEVDMLVPWETVHDWFEEAVSARHNVFYVVEGMGHGGCTDFPPNNEPLPGPEQARMHRRLVTGVLRTELLGQEDLFIDLLGEGIEVEPVYRQTDCEDPIFWADISEYMSDNLAIGTAGSRGGLAVMAWSLVPGSVHTPFGELGLDPDSLNIFYSRPLTRWGWHEEMVPIEPSWSGQTLYLQGLVRYGSGEGQLTRVVELEIP